VSETLAKTPEKHLETIANICNKHLKTLETYAYNMHVYATYRSTFATSKQNTLQHSSVTKETFGTYI
jgi:hypothetical protein